MWKKYGRLEAGHLLAYGEKRKRKRVVEKMKGVAGRIDKGRGNIYLKLVKNKIVGMIGPLILVMVLSMVLTPLMPANLGPLQDTRRPQDDYLNALLSRNAEPLGLKENPELEKLLRQAGVKWAVRSNRKHILN